MKIPIGIRDRVEFDLFGNIETMLVWEIGFYRVKCEPDELTDFARTVFRLPLGPAISGDRARELFKGAMRLAKTMRKP